MCKTPKRSSRSVSLLSGAAVLIAVSASADEAERLLGVTDIDPVVREVIDDAFADGSGSLPGLIKKVSSGQMHPGAAAEEIIGGAEGEMMHILKRLGLGAEALRMNTSWQAFAKARFEAKTSQNIKLPKLPKGLKAPSLPALHHHARKDDAPADIDKKLRQLDRQLAHTIETKPKVSHIKENLERESHVRDIHARAKTPDIQTPRPSIDRSLANGLANVARPGAIHPSVDTKLAKIDSIKPDVTRPSIDSSISKPAVNVGDIKTRLKNIGASVDPSTTVDKVKPSVNIADITQQVGDVARPDDIPQPGNISQQVNAATAGIDPSVNPALAQLNDLSNRVTAQVNPNVNPEVDPRTKIGDLRQRVEQSVDVDAIRQRVSAAVDPDALKKKIEGKVDVSSIRRKSTANIDVNLDKAKDRIKAAMKTVFGTVNGFMQKQVDQKQTDYNTAKANYNAIYVPPIRKHRVCVKHIVICVKHANVPIQSSVEAHNKALAKKKVAEGQMDGAYKELQKYQKGQDYVLQKETDTYGQLDTVFASANTSSDVAVQVSSDPAETATAEAPGKQKKRVPGGSHDHDVVVIADNITENIVSVGTITAAIGSDSVATTDIGAIGDISDTRVLGDIRQTIIAPGVISASLGYNTSADVRIGNIDGTVNGRLDRDVNAVGVLAAAIGGDSDASVELANINGIVNGSAQQDVTVVGALAASIGADTSARVHMANLGQGIRVGSLDQRIIQATPAIAAAIGYDADAWITAGQVNADVTGNVKQHINIGSVIAAAIGSRTETKIRIGEVNEKVTGDVTQNINAGSITNIAIGAGTKANTDVGVIDAPVTGDVTQNINTGVITTATVGVGTGAETVVGAIRAPVNGDVNQNISVGDITTFSIGLGIGGDADIRARSYVGSVFQPVNGPVNIKVNTGGIVSLGFGLDIDLGPFGELRIVESGCEGGSVRLGNIGNPC